MVTERVELIRIDKIIDSPWQGRLLSVDSRSRDVLREVRKLEKSIAQNGVMQPVTVRKKGHSYELIDGHRRVLAAKNLGHISIKAFIVDADDKEAQIQSVVANMERKDLHPIEKALAYQKILDSRVFRTRTELAERLGKTKAYVGEIMNNLNLDKRIIDDLLENKSITDNRILREIRKMGKIDEEGYNARQWEMYNRIIRENLTRDQVLKVIKLKDKDTIIRKKKVRVIDKKKEVAFVIDKLELNDEKKAELTVIIEEFVNKNTSWS